MRFEAMVGAMLECGWGVLFGGVCFDGCGCGGKKMWRLTLLQCRSCDLCFCS